MAGKKIPQHIQKVFDEELQKYGSIDENSSESNIVRTYLDWMVSLPYGVIIKKKKFFKLRKGLFRGLL